MVLVLALRLPLRSPDDLRDLQILWNLAWFDPADLAVSPLADLVERGQGFTEADKQLLHVAITRAADRLWIVAGRGRGRLAARTPEESASPL